MTAPNKPKIIKQTHSVDKLSLILFIQPELIYFQGHFNHFPVLAGVTQIDWAIYYGQNLLHCPKYFEGMEVIKFQVPILPDSVIELYLQWRESGQKLYFKFLGATAKDKKQYSSGRIKLSNNE